MAADELDDTQSALLAEYRDASGPAPDRKDGNWAALSLAIGGAGTATGAAASGGLLSAHGGKLALAVVALGLVGGAIATGSLGRWAPTGRETMNAVDGFEAREPIVRASAAAPEAPVAPAAALAEPAVRVASETAPVPGAVAPSATAERAGSRALDDLGREAPRAPSDLPAEPTSLAAPVPSDGSEAPAAAGASTLAEELTLLREARAAIRASDAAAALDALERHGARFPVGTLSAERESTRVWALCLAGRSDDAERVARTLEPSPAVTRALARCGTTEP